MHDWIQSFILVLIVTLAAVYLVWQVVRTFRGHGKMGSCCAKGCGSSSQTAKGMTSAGEKSPQASTQRIVFLPVEMLGRRK